MCKMGLGYFFLLFLLLASSAWADDPIQIERTSAGTVAGIFGCPSKSSQPPMNVRFHSMKTSSGLIFYRKTLDEDLFACFENGGSQSLSATNIKECAVATELAGLQMFRWENDTCTGYMQGIPKAKVCSKKEGVVVYSVDGGVRGQETFPLTLHHSVSSIWAEWAGCHPDYPSNVAKFTLIWNGSTTPLSGTTLEHRLKDIALCKDDLDQVDYGLKQVTLEAFDASDNSVMTPVTVTLAADNSVTTPAEMGVRYLLHSGNCIYYKGNTVTHDQVEAFCSDTLYGTTFIANTVTDRINYADDVSRLSSVNGTNLNEHFVGLIPVAGNWEWLSGLPQGLTFDDGATHQGEGGECGTLAPDLYYMYIVLRPCDGNQATVCHEYLP